MSLTRRRLLGAGTASVAASVAGCLGGSRSSSDGGTTTGDDLTVETLAVGDLERETRVVQPTGTVVLLDFFATWCQPCKPQMDHLGEIRNRFPEVSMLSVTWEDDRDLVAEFWNEHDGTWQVAMDPKVKTGEHYGVDRIPTLLVFDGDGKEVWRHTGLAAADSIAEQLVGAGATDAGGAGTDEGN